MTIRLIGCAIIRSGATYSGTFKSHAEVRDYMGDADPYRKNWDDEEGFWTNEEKFVSREDAIPLAIESGQLHAGWKTAQRKLLSSDIDW